MFHSKLRLFLLLQLSIVAGLSSTIEQPEHGATPAEDPSSAEYLLAKLQLPLEQKSEVVHQALQHIEALRSKPSCNRNAAMSLLQSCQVLGTRSEVAEKGQTGTEIALEKVKSIYAARLAVCELSEANLSVPSQCSKLTIQPQPCPTEIRWIGYSQPKKPLKAPPGIVCSPHISDHHLTNCLKTLESRPQSWTSYSNAKQNAIIICQASKEALDKERDLQTYKSLAGITGSLNDELARAREQASQAMAAYKVLTEILRNFRLKLTKEAEAAAAEFQSVFSPIIAQMESAGISIVDTLLQAIQKVDGEVGSLKENVRSANSDIKQVKEDVQDLQISVIKDLKVLAAYQRDELESNNILARDTMRILSVSFDLVTGLIRATNNTLEALEILSAKQRQIQRGQTALVQSQSVVIGRFQDLNTQISEASSSLQVILGLFSELGLLKVGISVMTTFALIVALPTVSLAVMLGLIGLPKACSVAARTCIMWLSMTLMLSSDRILNSLGILPDYFDISVSRLIIFCLFLLSTGLPGYIRRVLHRIVVVGVGSTSVPGIELS